MLADGLLLLRSVLMQTWRLMTSFTIPGTELTPAALIVGLFVIKLFIGQIKNLFNLGGNDDKSNSKSESKE